MQKNQLKKEIEQKSSCTQAMKSTEQLRCNLAPPTLLLLLLNCFLTLSFHFNIARCMSLILFYFIFSFLPEKLYIRPVLFLHCAVVKFLFRHRERRKPGSKTARFASKQVNDRKVAQGCHVVVLRHHVFIAKFRNLCYILCYVSNLNNFCSTFFFWQAFRRKTVLISVLLPHQD